MPERLQWEHNAESRRWGLHKHLVPVFGARVRAVLTGRRLGTDLVTMRLAGQHSERPDP